MHVPCARKTNQGNFHRIKGNSNTDLFTEVGRYGLFVVVYKHVTFMVCW